MLPFFALLVAGGVTVVALSLWDRLRRLERDVAALREEVRGLSSPVARAPIEAVDFSLKVNAAAEQVAAAAP